MPNPGRRYESDQEMLDDVFEYHAPDSDQVVTYQKIRGDAKSFAKTILALCPPCADRSAAIRKLREAVMTANAAVALRGGV